jgi:hypothetical protein
VLVVFVEVELDVAEVELDDAVLCEDEEFVEDKLEEELELDVGLPT